MKIRNLLLIILASILCLSLIACGGTCEHNDADGDGVCDKCGDEVAVTPPTECTEHKDENGDGKCDACGKTTGAPAGDGTVALVTDGKANFKIVVGSDAISRKSDIEKLIKKLNDRLDGEDLVYTEEADSTEQAVEILIGTVSSRGDEYVLDKYDYGEKGYEIKIVGTKIIVIGGSDSGLKDAIKALEEDVFGIVNKVTPITALTVTESIHKPQDDYKIESVTVGGTDLNDFVFAVDESQEANDLAAKYQFLFYSYTGDYLEIVPLTSLQEGQKAISIEIIENGGDRSTEEGFNLYISDSGSMVIECEFPNKLEETLGGLFDREIINTSKKNVEFASDYTYRPNIRIITYDQFGAIGNGEADDFAAIKAAHEYANEWGHTVHATGGKTYYIGNKTDGETVEIQTDTYWNGAKFIFDDSEILVHNSTNCSKNGNCEDCLVRGAAIFTFTRDRSSVSVTSILQNHINTHGGIYGGWGESDNTQKIDGWNLEYDSLVYFGTGDRKIWIRYGQNADGGDNPSEILLIRKDGTIDSSTPISWDYYSVSWATAYPIDDKPITLDGGGALIETIANRPSDNEYNAFSRNLYVARSNVTIQNFDHRVVDEQFYRSPYAGILYVRLCNNTTFRNITLQKHKGRYHNGVAQGTYEIGGTAANDIKYYNVSTINLFADGAADDFKDGNGALNQKGDIGYRGIMGTNYCRNFYFENCTLNSFDAHKGLGNLTIKGCTFGHINLMGSGTVKITDTVVYADAARSVVTLRQDYGASWRGDIFFDNVEMRFASDYKSGNPNNVMMVINCYEYNDFDFDSTYDPEIDDYVSGEGSTNYLPVNITINNLRLVKFEYKYVNGERVETELDHNDTLYLFHQSFHNMGNRDVSKFESEGGYAKYNRVIGSETITITNSYKILIPDTPQFSDTKISVDESQGEK